MNRFIFAVSVVFVACALSHPRDAFGQNASLAYLDRILNEEEGASLKSTERIASGRILLADDPANYAVYESLEKQIRELDKIVGNEADMISYYRLEDALLGNVIDVVQRIRELLLQRSNGTLSPSDLQAVDGEIDQLYDQFFDVLSQAEFNTKKIFLPFVDSGIVGELRRGGSYYRLESVDSLLTFLVEERVRAGTAVNAFELRIAGEKTARLNAEAAQAQGDTDIARETVNLKRDQLLMMVNILLLKMEAPRK